MCILFKQEETSIKKQSNISERNELVSHFGSVIEQIFHEIEIYSKDTVEKIQVLESDIEKYEKHFAVRRTGKLFNCFGTPIN